MLTDFRVQARNSLKRASALILSKKEEELRYGCLELRLCIEYLILDRFTGYQEYIDIDAAKNWTPKKIIEEMLENDPYADTNAVVAVGIEKEYGVSSDDMKVLGEDRRLKLKWANSNWQALGSFLHSPTLDQHLKGTSPSDVIMRERCQAIVAHLTHVLAAPLWSVTGGPIYELGCGACGNTTKRFAASITPERGFVCRTPKCGAIYDLEGEGPNFKMRCWEFACSKCDQKASFGIHILKVNNVLVCDGCETQWLLSQRFAVTEIVPPKESGPS